MNHINKMVVVEENEVEIGYFESLSDAARKYKTYTSTITNRILKGIVKNGIRFRYYTEEDKHLPNLSPERTPKYVKYNKTLKGGRAFKGDDIELDRKRYNIIAYEVKHNRICITPCPLRDNPRPFVGSARCAGCSSFHGRNKKTHEVACSRKIESYVNRKQ